MHQSTRDYTSLNVNFKKAKEILGEISSLQKEIAGIKIGSILCLKEGIKVVNKLKDICGFPIIFDAKKGGTDIPEIVKEQVRIVAEAGVDAIIGAPQGSGSATLTAFVEACEKHKVIPIIVIEMTHSDFDAFLLKDAGERILEKSLELGVENFVGPANKPGRLKLYKDMAKKKMKKIKIFSPGVGPQGGGLDSAVRAGVDFIILGRTISQAKNPKEEVLRVYELIKKIII